MNILFIMWLKLYPLQVPWHNVQHYQYILTGDAGWRGEAHGWAQEARRREESPRDWGEETERHRGEETTSGRSWEEAPGHDAGPQGTKKKVHMKKKMFWHVCQIVYIFFMFWQLKAYTATLQVHVLFYRNRSNRRGPTLPSKRRINQ